MILKGSQGKEPGEPWDNVVRALLVFILFHRTTEHLGYLKDATWRGWHGAH
jgi:hypothetical protein